jgi:hypothetical protein
MDVLSHMLPMEVSPASATTNGVVVMYTPFFPTGTVLAFKRNQNDLFRGNTLLLFQLTFFIAAQERRWRVTSPNYKAKIKTI